LTERRWNRARALRRALHWVALQRFDALPERELKQLLSNAYQLILENYPEGAGAIRIDNDKGKAARKRR